MKAVYHCTYKLKKNADVAAFLQAAKALNNGHISQQPGYVSWQQLHDGNTWVDIATFDSMESLNTFKANSAKPGELAKHFYSFINMFSCKVRYYTVERSY